VTSTSQKSPLQISMITGFCKYGSTLCVNDENALCLKNLHLLKGVMLQS